MMTPAHAAGRVLTRVALPIAPHSLRLRYFVARLLGCEPELLHLHQFAGGSGLAIDAGANEGLYVHRLASLFREVVAFEISPTLAGKLARSAPPNVSVRPMGLSDRAGTMTLRIPIAHGMTLAGWGSVEENHCPDATRYLEESVEVRPLDSFGLSPSFLKVDVEGHECALLRGARQTLAAHRPTVLIEVKASHRDEVRAFFSELRYREHTLRNLAGIEGSPQNLIYVPL
jgi:FkbM family methyltransferase